MCVFGCFSSVEHLEYDSCQEDVRQSWIWRSSCCGQLSGENGIICHRLRNVSGITCMLVLQQAHAPRTSPSLGSQRIVHTRRAMSEQKKEAANVYVPHNQEHGPQTDGNAASLLLFIGGVQLWCLTNRQSTIKHISTARLMSLFTCTQ